MFTIKDIKIGSYEEYYKQNIQLQFLNDSKFTTFMQNLCTEGCEGYQQVLKNLNDSFNLDNQILSGAPQIAILNAIGGLIGLPPITYFVSVNPETAGQTISLENYILLIKGKQLQNQFDGTNISIINELNALLPQYKWDLLDRGIMSITIYMTQKTPQNPIDADIQNLFESGWLTPKPAGVSVTYVTATSPFFTWDSSEVNEQWDSGVWA